MGIGWIGRIGIFVNVCEGGGVMGGLYYLGDDN